MEHVCQWRMDVFRRSLSIYPALRKRRRHANQQRETSQHRCTKSPCRSRHLRQFLRQRTVETESLLLPVFTRLAQCDNPVLRLCPATSTRQKYIYPKPIQERVQQEMGISDICQMELELPELPRPESYRSGKGNQ